MNMQSLTHLQEIYFDVCDLLNGESIKDLGYKNQKELLGEFKWKTRLNHITQ
jgi:hypothetical protein